MSTWSSCLAVVPSFSFVSKQDENYSFTSSEISHTSAEIDQVAIPAGRTVVSCAGDIPVSPASLLCISSHYGQPSMPVHDVCDNSSQSLPTSGNRHSGCGNDVIRYCPPRQKPDITLPDKMQFAQFELGVHFPNYSPANQTTAQTFPCFSPSVPVNQNFRSEDPSEPAIHALTNSPHDNIVEVLAHNVAASQRKSVVTEHSLAASQRRNVVTKHSLAASQRRNVVTEHSLAASQRRNVFTEHSLAASQRRNVVTEHSLAASQRRNVFTEHSLAASQKRNVVTEHSLAASHKRVLPPCRVCGSVASGFHYGVNTCEACKGFFRRSLKKGSTLRCRGQSSCTVRGDKRNQCAYCRYQRCLALGMSKMAIKTGRYTHQKRTQDILEVRGLCGSDIGPPDAKEREVEDLLAPILEAGYALHQSIRTYPLERVVTMQTGADSGCTSHENTPGMSNLFFETLRHLLCTETGLSAAYSSQLRRLASHYISFARSLPLFPSLVPDDQLVLLTSCWLEVLILGAGLRDHSRRNADLCVHFPELLQLAGVDFVETVCQILNSLKRLLLTAEESIVVRALILISGDRFRLQNHRTADKSQWLVVRCLLHLLKRNHGKNCGRKFAEIISHVTSIRAITEEFEKLKVQENSRA